MNVKMTALLLIATVVGLRAVPSLAEPALPAQQSNCEIRANEFKAQHPHVDPFDYLKFGFFFFGGTAPPQPPSTYRDPESGITFYVEADGRYIRAIDANGKLLWVRNPFVDRDMCPYRSAHPYIFWIGPPGGDFGRHYLGPFKATPEAQADALIVKQINSEIARGRKIEGPRNSDRFIGLSFNSSQFGYVNTRNGDYYDMGQD